jgi:uncharacterized protein
VTTLLIIFICGFLAFSIGAICGGGSGFILIPILSGLLPINQVPAALSIGTFTSTASRIVLFKKNICWHIVKYFVPFAIIAVWLGVWLLRYINPIYLEIAMGLFLVSNLTFILKKPKQICETKKPTTITLILIGFMAGFLSGLTGAIGPLLNRFYFRYGLTGEEILATRAANEIILHLVKIILYSLFGLISIDALSIGIVIALSSILSALSMKWILPRIKEVTFKKIGYSAMVIAGFTMLLNSGNDLFAVNSTNTNSKSKGLETKIKSKDAPYLKKFTFHEGF